MVGSTRGRLAGAALGVKHPQNGSRNDLLPGGGGVAQCAGCLLRGPKVARDRGAMRQPLEVPHYRAAVPPACSVRRRGPPRWPSCARRRPGDTQRRARVGAVCARWREGARWRAWWIAWRMRRCIQCRSAGGSQTVVRVDDGVDDGVAELREGPTCPIKSGDREGAVSKTSRGPCPIRVQ